MTEHRPHLGMQPTAAQIARYRELYRRRGIDISNDEAQAEGAALMQLISIIYRSLTKNEYGKYKSGTN